MYFGLLILFSLLNTAWCDYKCICSYAVERNVYSMPSNTSNSIGHLYEFDCKPLVNQDVADWFTVAYEHKLGYVEKGDKVQTQTCPGQYPDADKVTNSSTTTLVSSSNSNIPASAKPFAIDSIVPDINTTVLALTTPVALASTKGPTSPITLTTNKPRVTRSALQDCEELTHHSSTAFAKDNICYELATQHKPFSDAERECMSKGGHLAHILSTEEQNFLTENIRQFVGDTYIWIGLQDTSIEEHFEWTSGEQLSYTNWYPYRKNLLLHGIEDCVAMTTQNFVKVYDGEWEDLPCSRAHSYICQFDISTGLQVVG